MYKRENESTKFYTQNKEKAIVHSININLLRIKKLGGHEMKVLLPIEYYPPFVMGGAEISAKLLAEGLADLGVEVHVLTPKYNLSSEYSEENGVFVHRFESPRKILFKGRRVSRETYVRQRALYYLMISKYIRFSAREFCKKITKIHSKEKFDLIHAQNVESVFGLNFSNVNCPKIAHLRGLQYFCIDGSKWSGSDNCVKCTVKGIENCFKTHRFFAKLIKRELKWRRENIHDFNHYVTVSKYVAQEAEKQGLPLEKLSPLHNPLDESQISDLSKETAKDELGWDFENIVLVIGGITEVKGIKLLPKIAKRVPEANFIVVGGGHLEDWLLKKQDSIKNLHYVGQFPFKEIKHCYKAADILFVPSIWQEPYPRVVIEEQANRVCAVAFAVGGIPEAIEHRKTGFLVNRNDVEGAASILRQLLDDRGLIKKIGESAKRKVMKENLKSKFAKKILRIYHRIPGCKYG